MTFDQFCEANRVTANERDELTQYLVWLRVRPALQTLIRLELLRLP